MFSLKQNSFILNLFFVKSLFFVLLVSFFSCSEDPISTPETSEEFTAYLQEELEVNDYPALSVLLFRGEEVLEEHTLGEASLETGRALSSDDLFLLASVSKAITGTALLQLVDDGLLDLDDPINSYLPFAVTIPGQASAITFRHLLTHTSGIADGEALDGQYYTGRDSPILLGDYLREYLTPSGNLYNASDNFYNFSPGTQHEYSNTGSALVGYLVEVISGQPFDEYCKSKIFAPLGMQTASWRLAGIQAPLVELYNYERNRNERVEAYTFTDYPNGGLRCNARELHRFAAALAQNGEAFGARILSVESANAMMTPQLPSLDASVGLHFFSYQLGGNLWGHEGGEQGTSTIMVFDPISDIGVIVLTNQSDAELEEIVTQSMQYAKSL